MWESNGNAQRANSDAEPERLVPLETWLHENARVRSIWRSGSPRLTCPADMGKWLRRHEARLTECGAVLRLGKAWRIVEPAFRSVLFEILAGERKTEVSHEAPH